MGQLEFMNLQDSQTPLSERRVLLLLRNDAPTPTLGIYAS